MAIITDNLLQRLDPNARQLVSFIANEANQHNLRVFIVGGIVRDLLLGRPNQDIDFVVEGDAIAFSRGLHEKFGGTTVHYAPFGTSKWVIPPPVADSQGIDLSRIKPTIDFAMSRQEVYAYPTALPTVSPSAIRHDLQRRDFSINALAIQISPEFGVMLDAFNGLHDLEHGILRVLHDDSFTDDPTRMLRGIRFAQRFGFRLDEHTQTLYQNALPMLGRITGERLQNEIALFFQEPQPHYCIGQLHRDALDTAIAPAFNLPDQTLHDLQALIQPFPSWTTDTLSLGWHLLLARIPENDLSAVMKRLLIPQSWQKSIQAMAQVFQLIDLGNPDLKPSQVVEILEPLSATAHTALWILGTPPIKDRLTAFVSRWQHIRPYTNGKTLIGMGHKPSPLFAKILGSLRQAWLDNLVHNETEENDLLTKLLKEVANRDPER